MIGVSFEEIRAESDVEKLILLRKRYHLKQYQLAELIGYSPNYIANVENYNYPISAKMKKKIEEVIPLLDTRRGLTR